MKRIFSSLFAIIVLVGTTGIFTACQEDAPEINYTINVTVNNDFTEVVNAINNGTMKQEAAIAALTAAIEKMQGDQNAKLDAIVEAINTLATTLDAKLAIIEAAMKAQTLALETKLGLIEAAIKALPDYADRLKAIEAAIKGMPDYSDKLAAIETALEAIAANIEAQEGQYADELAALTEAIDAIQSEVAAGNKSREDALAEIIALLESGALAGGGSGSGSGGESEGGEGEVDESYYVTFKSNQGFSIVVPRSEKNIYKIEGATVIVKADVNGFSDTNSEFKKNFLGTIIQLQPTAGVVTLKGKITQLISENGPTEINATQNKMLEALELYGVQTLVKLTVANDGALKYIDLMRCIGLEGANATAFMNSLPTRTAADDATLIVKDRTAIKHPSFSVDDIAIAQGKNWKVIDNLGEEQIGRGEIDEDYYITFKSNNSEIKISIPQSEKGIYKIEGATVTKTEDFSGIGTVAGSFMEEYKNTELTLKPTTVGGEVKISGKITGFIATEEGLTEVNASHNQALELLYIPRNYNLQKLEIAEVGDLKYLYLNQNQHSDLQANAQNIVSSLLNITGVSYMEQIFTTEQRDALAAKGWTWEHF